MNRREIEDQQQEIVDEANAIQRVMSNVDALTELARGRMARAVQTAEQASGALARGSTGEAAPKTGEAAAMFRELAAHVEGLSAAEIARRIALSADLAEKLARRERELGDADAGRRTTKPIPWLSVQQRPKKPSRPSQTGRSGGGQGSGSRGSQPGSAGGLGSSDSPGDADLAGRAALLADSGLTLQDLLEALASMESQGDSEAPQEVRRLLSDGELARVVERMEGIERLVRKADASVMRLETREIAEYLERLGLRLDTLQRRIVAPRLEKLMALEREASDLRGRLEKQDSRLAFEQWHHEAEKLVRSLNDSSAAGHGADGLLDAMRGAGWGDGLRSVWEWAEVDRRYTPPAVYVNSLGVIITQLQQDIRELLLRELMTSDDEATPPEYRELVDRYFEVLSRDIGR